MELMDLLFISVLFVAISIYANWRSAVEVSSVMKRKKEENENEETQEKVCPPHKWRYVEQPGEKGVYFIKCMICNKTPSEISLEE